MSRREEGEEGSIVPGKRDRTHIEQASRDVWWSLATTVLSGNENPWYLDLNLPQFLERMRPSQAEDEAHPLAGLCVPVMRASGGTGGVSLALGVFPKGRHYMPPYQQHLPLILHYPGTWGTCHGAPGLPALL